MEVSRSPKAPRMRHARKSIAYLPPSDAAGDKENATVDSTSFNSMSSKTKSAAKKSRSKSLGPGGIDALKETTGNQAIPSLQPIRSILKPSMPFSPTKANTSKSPGRASPGRAGGRRTPQGSPTKSPRVSPSKRDTGAQGDPFQSPKQSEVSSWSPSRSPARVAVKTEEEQQALAREKEQEEIQARREARRKSLATRRVSFAPEATLHTWNVVEMPEDSTTSSAASSSTRRSSGLIDNQPSSFNDPSSLHPSSDGSEPPSTPPEKVDESHVAQSPVYQRDLHQKKRRRSSIVAPVDLGHQDDLSSSPSSGDSADDTSIQAFETADEGSDSSESDDKDLVEDETVTNIDGDDNTFHSADSTASSGRLDAALQQAARQAGTQGIEYDEHGELTMEMADDEVTEAFKPWMSKNKEGSQVGDASALLDQENVNPFSPAFKANVIKQAESEAEDSTMDMTQAIGGILPSNQILQSPVRSKRRKSVAASKRRSSVARRRSSGNASSLDGDQTMDLTTAIGGIEASQNEPAETSDDAEELTMEFTSVVGGVVQASSAGSGDSEAIEPSERRSSMNRRESMSSMTGDEDMDLTHAVGGILLPSITERSEPPEDETMEVTTAIGSILQQQPSTGSKQEAKALMEREANVGHLSAASEFHDGSPQKPVGAGLTDERPLPSQNRKTPMASSVGSSTPSHTAQSYGNSDNSSTSKSSNSPKPQKITPLRKPATPSKQLTPKPVRPLTPGKTPPPKNVAMRSASPKKLFETEITSAKKQATQTTPQAKPGGALFEYDPATGKATPSIVLKPRKRRSSGLGIDREGLGSPRVRALLDRRGSIGENAKTFKSHVSASTGVRFEDPRVMELAVDEERADDKRRESGRDIFQDEADDKAVDENDITANLKAMIGSLSPEKKKVKGRKSLHVGAAKGLLGKRPVELDEEEQDDSPKKFKGRDGSPVKNVRLPAPPSKVATTGRMTRSQRMSLAESNGNSRTSTPLITTSPNKKTLTPKNQARFKDAEAGGPSEVTSFEQKAEGIQQGLEVEEGKDQIHLQDFLNMTGIRFMELTTTKRRHTVAPNGMQQDGRQIVQQGQNPEITDPVNDFENCVVVSTCTVPMLELYQHSCRELKNYIAEGRKVAKEIEEATFEDNPPLFREYMVAPADVKAIMDNQFKNVKTNARLLSKAMWYEWRMKLLDGLKEGLSSIGQGMEQDDRQLRQQEQILQTMIPAITEEHEKLTNQVAVAEAQAAELAGCDQEELKETRDHLVSIEQELEKKRLVVEDLQNQLREREDGLEAAVGAKEECIHAIKEAEQIRQDCRGWSTDEVAALQTSVRNLEAETGWIMSGAVLGQCSLTYDKAIELRFSPSAFLPNDLEVKASEGDNAPISLTYVADTAEYRVAPLTTEKRFFLQIIRAQLQCMRQSQTKPKDLLGFVSDSWNTAVAIADEIKALDIGYVTDAAITGDETMIVRSVIFLREMQTKVEITIDLKVQSQGETSELGLATKAAARVCYGETLNEKKMSEFLESRIKGIGRYGVWVNATRELEEKLVMRGKKP